MRRLITTLRRWWTGLQKRAGDVIDIFKPRGYVEARLYYADGPRKGELHRVIRGRNIVTSWLDPAGDTPTGGRDMLRRVLIPDGFGGQLSSDPNAVIGRVELGSGTTAETSTDAGLESPIGGGTPTTIKDLASVALDVTNPWVTFVFDYAEGEANATISEAGLYSLRDPGDGRGDFIARKTFGSFTKTAEFTLQIRWQIRF